MTATGDDLGSQLCLFVFLMLVVLCLLSLMRHGNQVKWSDLRGVPFFLIPLVYCAAQFRAGFRLRRAERIRAFRERADDSGMREQRAHGFLPRRTRR